MYAEIEHSDPLRASSPEVSLDPEIPGETRLIASRRHLAIFVAFQVVLALNGGITFSRLAAIKDQPTFHTRLAYSYLVIFAVEFVQLFYIWFGVKKTTKISDLVGGRWTSAWKFVKDLLLGFALWLLWMLATIVLVIAIQPQRGQSPDIRTILPRTPMEIGLWIAISAAAGFCEEVVYRGYLQRQFLALSQNLNIAIIGQAVIFASIHRYQGAFNILAITALGILFGSFAARRKSLRPGIIAHMWHDAFLGVLFFYRNFYH